MIKTKDKLFNIPDSRGSGIPNLCFVNKAGCLISGLHPIAKTYLLAYSAILSAVIALMIVQGLNLGAFIVSLILFLVFVFHSVDDSIKFDKKNNIFSKNNENYTLNYIDCLVIDWKAPEDPHLDFEVFHLFVRMNQGEMVRISLSRDYGATRALAEQVANYLDGRIVDTYPYKKQ